MSVLFKILIVLNFYSALTVYPNIYIEHYPYGILFLIIVFLKQKKLDNFQLLILAIFLLCIYLTTIIISQEITLKTWKLLISYMNFISPMFFLKYLDKHAILSAVNFVFYSSLVMGVLQFFGVLSVLNIDLSFMISRFGVGEFGGYRGVSLFSTEPVRASFTLFCAAVILASYNKSYRFLIISLLFDIIFIRSTTGLLLYIILFSCVLIRSRYKTKGIGFFFLVILLVYYFSDLIFHPYSKVLIIINALKENDIHLAYVIFDELSGGRVAGIVNGVKSFFTNPIGSFAYSDVLTEGKIVYEGQYSARAKISHTPVSGFITFANIYGVLFILQIYLALKYIKVTINRMQKSLFWGGGGALFIYSPPGMSISLFTLMLLVKSSSSNNKHFN